MGHKAADKMTPTNARRYITQTNTFSINSNYIIGFILRVFPHNIPRIVPNVMQRENAH